MSKCKTINYLVSACPSGTSSFLRRNRYLSNICTNMILKDSAYHRSHSTQSKQTVIEEQKCTLILWPKTCRSFHFYWHLEYWRVEKSHLPSTLPPAIVIQSKNKKQRRSMKPAHPILDLKKNRSINFHVKG